MSRWKFLLKLRGNDQKSAGASSDDPRSKAGISLLVPVVASIAASRYRMGMCRSIKTLRRADEAATTGELEAAARQYVRKISGYRMPSSRNVEAFEGAIAEIAAASTRMLEALGVDIEEGPDRWIPSGARQSGVDPGRASVGA